MDNGIIGMAELLTFIGNLNLGTFIALWTSTIFILIFILVLLFSVSQINKQVNIISKKVKILVAELADKKLKLGDDDI